jgi:hypothetical protein
MTLQCDGDAIEPQVFLATILRLNIVSSTSLERKVFRRGGGSNSAKVKERLKGKFEQLQIVFGKKVVEGLISLPEFVAACEKLSLNLSANEVEIIFRKL